MKQYIGIKKIEIKDSNIDEIAMIGNALSCPTRIKMLKLIANGINTITTLSKKMNIPSSNIVFHLQILEKAGVIYTSHLSQKLVASPVFDHLEIDINNVDSNHFYDSKEIEYQIPIGAYIRLTNLANHLGALDENGEKLNINEYDVYDQSRFNAQQIYFRRGLLTYPLRSLKDNQKLKCVYISFEACSEINAYKPDYKSDISILINNKHIYTYTVPGDFGGRKGLLNPMTIPTYFTQFGHLISIHITEKGTFFNGVLVDESLTINQINLLSDRQNTLSIGNMPDCSYQGGMNIFGEKLGDFPQAIKVKYVYDEQAN